MTAADVSTTFHVVLFLGFGTLHSKGVLVFFLANMFTFNSFTLLISYNCNHHKWRALCPELETGSDRRCIRDLVI